MKCYSVYPDIRMQILGIKQSICKLLWNNEDVDLKKKDKIPCTEKLSKNEGERRNLIWTTHQKQFKVHYKKTGGREKGKTGLESPTESCVEDRFKCRGVSVVDLGQD